MNKTQRIDPVFEADQSGNYLTGNSELLADHIPGIQAAFRMTAEDLQAVLTDAGAIPELTLANLSLIYRYTVLAKALKLTIPDFLLLKEHIEEDPFNNPEDTLTFCTKAASVKESGFKPVTLHYIFTGELPADSSLAPDIETIKQTVRIILGALFLNEQEHPVVPAAPLTSEILRGKLSITFRPDVVDQFISIIESTATFTATFTTFSSKGLQIEIPEELAVKYHYIKKSRKLSCTGVMTDDERIALKSLDGAAPNFAAAVDELYSMQEAKDFINNNFSTIFADIDAAILQLVNHPDPAIDDKLQLVYENYLPLLKEKLRKDLFILHMSALLGLSEAAARVLIKEDELQQLVEVFLPYLPLDLTLPDVEIPDSIMEDFSAVTHKYHRAAAFITGFNLNKSEIEHLITNAADFDHIDFTALEPLHWFRIFNYVTLRNALPQAQATLLDVFTEANNPASTLVTLKELLIKATAWDTGTLDELLQHFQFEPQDFKNEKKLSKIQDVMQMVTKTGASAETLKKWGDTVSNFPTLNETAQWLQHIVKAKYGESDWLQLAGGLSDKIRENRKQALISYLLVQPELRDWGVIDADSLFEYFLIDVQMGACMDTSRIVQANSSIQLFVTRCLLNLESDLSSGDEKGVSPDHIDAERWEWQKNYRVWEANRKIFLYPENWLEPEWRDDRSPFFRELESELVQNDITERSVEKAFRDYLSKVN